MTVYPDFARWYLEPVGDDFPRNVVIGRRGIVAVCENHKAKLVVGEPVDQRLVPNHAAVVPVVDTALERASEPAQRVQRHIKGAVVVRDVDGPAFADIAVDVFGKELLLAKKALDPFCVVIDAGNDCRRAAEIR